MSVEYLAMNSWKEEVAQEIRSDNQTYDWWRVDISSDHGHLDTKDNLLLVGGGGSSTVFTPPPPNNNW